MTKSLSNRDRKNRQKEKKRNALERERQEADAQLAQEWYEEEDPAGGRQPTPPSDAEGTKTGALDPGSSSTTPSVATTAAAAATEDPGNMQPETPAEARAEGANIEEADAASKLRYLTERYEEEKAQWYEDLRDLQEQLAAAKEDVRRAEADRDEAKDLLLQLHDDCLLTAERLDKKDAEIEKLDIEASQERHRVTVVEKENNRLKSEKLSFRKAAEDSKSKLTDAINRRNAAESHNDSYRVNVEGLQNEVAHLTCAYRESEEDLREVHAAMDRAFVGMASDLSRSQQLDLLREQHDAAVQALAVSGSSAEDESEDNSEAEGGRKAQRPAPLTLSALSVVETAPVTTGRGVSSTGTQTAGAVVAAVVAAPPSLVSCGVQTTAPPTKSAGTQTAPLAGEQVAVPVAVTPRWMWVVFLAIAAACLAAFAALSRERQLWVVANDLTYLRFAGTETEGWVDWFGLGLAVLAGGTAGSSGLGSGLLG